MPSNIVKTAAAPLTNCRKAIVLMAQNLGNAERSGGAQNYQR